MGTDYQYVSLYQYVFNEVVDVSEVGSILAECKAILFSQCNFKVKFIRRYANMMVPLGLPLTMLIPFCLMLCLVVFLS